MFAYIQNQWVHDLTNYNMAGNSGWEEIEGDADNYDPKDDRGLPHYKLINGSLVEDGSYPVPEPSHCMSDLACINTLENDNEMLTECILEMSEIIYGE